MSTPNTNAVIITGKGTISAVVNGQSYTIETDHPQYTELLEAARNYDWATFVDNVDISKKVSMYVNDNLQVVNGVVLYHDTPIHNTLTERIVTFMAKDLPFTPLLKFLDNLLANPSKRAVDELYDFLDAGELPITEDGCFLAYKNVKADYRDIHSGKFSNKIGDTCEMPRNLVDEDKNRTCSTGLHFCSIKYLPHFSDSNGGHTMIVKINPADVVAIPADYNNTKGRTSKYIVVGEYTDDWRSKLDRDESGWNAFLYDENGNEYEEDEEGCDENHCFCNQQDDDGDQVCQQDSNQVGNQGDDRICGGCNDNYGKKPDGSLFHNVRDAFGRFIKNNGKA